MKPAYLTYCFSITRLSVAYLLSVFQGPVNIKTGTSATVTFRNVFPANLTFNVAVSDPVFHISKQQEHLGAHKEARIVVSYKAPPEALASKAPIVGKLTVTCRPCLVPGVDCYEWIYYLRGIVGDWNTSNLHT